MGHLRRRRGCLCRSCELIARLLPWRVARLCLGGELGRGLISAQPSAIDASLTNAGKLRAVHQVSFLLPILGPRARGSLCF